MLIQSCPQKLLAILGHQVIAVEDVQRLRVGPAIELTAISRNAKVSTPRIKDDCFGELVSRCLLCECVSSAQSDPSAFVSNLNPSQSHLQFLLPPQAHVTSDIRRVNSPASEFQSYLMLGLRFNLFGLGFMWNSFTKAESSLFCQVNEQIIIWRSESWALSSF